VEPSEDAATWRERADGIIVMVASSEGPARISVVWGEPDAPTYGAPLDGETLLVEAPDGLVVTDRNGAWFLAGINEQPVIPARTALIRGLDRRFRSHAIPEPGLPTALRGQPASWELASMLLDAIAARAEVVQWDTDPLWTRKLVKARKSGALTPTEAALIAWLYAKQGQMDAQWALVYRADRGPGGDVSPAGYDATLVRLLLDDEERWLDPGCAECAPFEVRTELLGADVLGDDLFRTPDPEEGRWTAVFGDDWVRWELVGPAALDLRRWLSGIPIDQRWDALAGRMAGPGAELVEAEGIEELGGEIRVAARGGNGVGADPLALPITPVGRTAWLSWPGVREVVWMGREPMTEIKLLAGALTYTRTTEEESVVERLQVHDRQIAASDVAAVRRLRASGRAQNPKSADPAEDDPGHPGEDSDPGEQDGDGEQPAGDQPRGGGDGAGLESHEPDVEGPE
jgi:hypothetical protein